VEFRALGGAKQDAPLAQLFVSSYLGQLLVSRLTHFFRRRKSASRRLCRAIFAGRPSVR